MSAESRLTGKRQISNEAAPHATTTLSFLGSHIVGVVCLRREMPHKFTELAWRAFLANWRAARLRASAQPSKSHRASAIDLECGAQSNWRARNWNRAHFCQTHTRQKCSLSLSLFLWPARKSPVVATGRSPSRAIHSGWLHFAQSLASRGRLGLVSSAGRRLESSSCSRIWRRKNRRAKLLLPLLLLFAFRRLFAPFHYAIKFLLASQSGHSSPPPPPRSRLALIHQCEPLVYHASKSPAHNARLKRPISAQRPDTCCVDREDEDEADEEDSSEAPTRSQMGSSRVAVDCFVGAPNNSKQPSKNMANSSPIIPHRLGAARRTGGFILARQTSKYLLTSLRGRANERARARATHPNKPP